MHVRLQADAHSAQIWPPVQLLEAEDVVGTAVETGLTIGLQINDLPLAVHLVPVVQLVHGFDGNSWMIQFNHGITDPLFICMTGELIDATMLKVGRLIFAFLIHAMIRLVLSQGLAQLTDWHAVAFWQAE